MVYVSGTVGYQTCRRYVSRCQRYVTERNYRLPAARARSLHEGRTKIYSFGLHCIGCSTPKIGHIPTRAEEAYVRSLYQEIYRTLPHVRLNTKKLNQGRRTDSTDERCGVVEWMSSLSNLIGLKDLNAPPPQPTKPRYLELHKNSFPQSYPQ